VGRQIRCIPDTYAAERVCIGLGNPFLSRAKTNLGSSPTSVPTMEDIERFLQQMPLHMKGRCGGEATVALSTMRKASLNVIEHLKFKHESFRVSSHASARIG
jgi:hypothetical protein